MLPVLRRNICSSISIFLRVAAFYVYLYVYLYVYPHLLRHILRHITYTYTSTYYVYVYRHSSRLLLGLLLFSLLLPLYVYVIRIRICCSIRSSILRSIRLRYAHRPRLLVFLPLYVDVYFVVYVYVLPRFSRSIFLVCPTPLMTYPPCVYVTRQHILHPSCSFGFVRGSSSSYVYVPRLRQLHMSPVKLPTVMSRASTTHFWHFFTYSSNYSSTYLISKIIRK